VSSEAHGPRDWLAWLTEALLLFSLHSSASLPSSASDDSALPALIAQVPLLSPLNHHFSRIRIVE
jgi:hypothetical protein